MGCSERPSKLKPKDELQARLGWPMGNTRSGDPEHADTIAFDEMILQWLERVTRTFWKDRYGSKSGLNEDRNGYWWDGVTYERVKKRKREVLEELRRRGGADRQQDGHEPHDQEAEDGDRMGGG